MRKFFTRFGIRIAFVLFAVLASMPKASAQDTIPELWGVRVHDLAKVLTQATVDQLENKLKLFEDSTTDQIAILIVPTIGDEPIDSYSLRVAEKWKLGTKKNDNGVLLVVAVNDHKMRIEVGLGLEGVLTDAQCNRIIRNEMAPDFRKGDYEAGISSAVDAILKAIKGEYKAADADGHDSGMGIIERLITGFFVFGLLYLFTQSAVLSTGCSSWATYFILIPFYALFTWVIIGTIAATILFFIYFIGTPIAKFVLPRSKWGKAKMDEYKKTMATNSGGRSRGGGWGGFIGGALSVGSSFAGGGGSFGGGGSSGSW